MHTAHVVLFFVLGVGVLSILLLVVRAALRWFLDRGGDLGPLTFVLDFLEHVTDPLVYPVRHMLPEERRSTNFPVVVSVIVLAVIWVVIYGFLRIPLK